MQPIIAKQILPWFGGSAAVWTTCLVFFQSVLLAGYAYADWTLRLGARRQALLHIGLLAASLATLPILASSGWKPQGDEQPIARILLLLAATIGLPYFLLSTTTPLLQSWYWRRFRSVVPYRLFALSNFASLLRCACTLYLEQPTHVIAEANAEMARVVRLGERAAASNIPILIEGESGVGKEMIARAIQGESDRRGKPFVAVNCGALPENLVESILFGHEKGAFTGATSRHIGKFQEANGGTLFLDEVAELPLDIQVKLLRALQEGEVDPVGARRPVRVNIRLISATNRNMIEMVKAGQFREDLYYRLHVFPIMVPPLRQRSEDVAELVQHFIVRFAAEEGRKIRTIDPQALAMLQAYAWPGNVRQLENAIERAVLLGSGVIEPADLGEELRFYHLVGIALILLVVLLPESVDFPLYPQREPETFKAILFGDPQPRDQQEVDYIAHDVLITVNYRF